MRTGNIACRISNLRHELSVILTFFVSQCTYFSDNNISKGEGEGEGQREFECENGGGEYKYKLTS